MSSALVRLRAASATLHLHNVITHRLHLMFIVWKLLVANNISSDGNSYFSKICRISQLEEIMDISIKRTSIIIDTTEFISYSKLDKKVM